jgi:radical SAM superfamily enzyme YgiQ (UPF0313 family)|tara:strand:+ start:621 stop:2099 length:1479 start_codon:yes stop_codon:yes gene_type:complete
MKKIILVFPGQYRVNDVNIPLSLLYIANPLLKHGYDVQIVDARIEDFRKVDYRNILYAGISTMSGLQIYHGVDVAKFIRRQNPDAKLIWGGPHPTIIPGDVINSPYADIVVRGEGEETLLRLTECLVNKKNYDNIPGLTFKNNGKVHSSANNSPVDLNTTGNLPYHLLKMEKYPNIIDKFEYISSKGCPHPCTFCSDAANYGRGWRAKSSETVISELECIISAFRPKRITIQDANFFVSRKRVEEICRAIIKKDWNIDFYTCIRSDYVPRYSNEMMELIRKSGFKELAFGAESGSNRLLAYIKKQQKTDKMIKTVEQFKKFDIKPIISLMIGLPTETKEELNETIDLYDKIMDIHPGAMVNGIFIFTPFPGSELARILIKEYGYRFPETLEEWGQWKWSSPKNITWVEKEAKERYEAIYLIVRFLFVYKLLHNWSFWQLKARCGSSVKAISVLLFNISFYPFAKIRWKKRLFKYPLEMKLWYMAYSKFKGVD